MDLDGKVFVYKKKGAVREKVFLTEGIHYFVEYPEGKNIKTGTASLLLHGMGEYGGSKKVTFKISSRTMAWWWNLMQN